MSTSRFAMLARAVRRCALVVAGTLVVGACTLGPDFRAPDPPAVEQYTRGVAPAAKGMPRLVAARDLPAEWWTVFASPQIDMLVRNALEKSPSLDQARARLLQAQELRTARTGATTYPQVDATFGAVRQRIDPATFGFPEAPNPGPFNVFSLGANVSYNFDLFGGTRRDLEAYAAEVDYQTYELEGARLTLASNVVVTAIREAALAAQIEILDKLLSAQRQQLVIVEQRHVAGGAAQLDVETQKALLAQSESALPALHARRAQAQHQLAVLMGIAPTEAQIPVLRLADLQLPAEIPLRVPSELVRRRPDILASEALLHKASAGIGVATADLYPKLVVSGAFSSSQLDISDVLGSGINIWNIGLNLVQPIFRHNELKARQRAAEAAFAQAAAGYRLTVLQGLQSVADVLRTLEADARGITARSDQSARADNAYRITIDRYSAGGVSHYAVLDAQRRQLDAQLELVRLQGDLYADTATLFQAMGGGWSGVTADNSR